MAVIKVDTIILTEAMRAISKLQGSLGIDLVDEDGYGQIYFELERLVREAEL